MGSRLPMSVFVEGLRQRQRRSNVALRLLAALTLTLTAIGLVQYEVMSRRFERDVVEEGKLRQRANVETFGRAFHEGPAGDKLARVQDVVTTIAAQPFVTGVNLTNAQGVVVASSDDDVLGTVEPDKAQRREQGAYSGRERDRDEDSSGFEFVSPVTWEGRRFVLEVNQNGVSLARRRARLRADILLLLIVGLVVGPPVFYACGARGVSRRHRRVVERSLRDELTKLGNHGAYQNEIRLAEEQAVSSGRGFSLALIDLDDFKLANDRHGHQHGDWVLSELGRLLEGQRRGDRAFRIGGDEFAMLFSDSSGEDARHALERIRLAAAARLQGPTLSIGLAAWSTDTMSVEQLHEQADDALYEAKRAGRNRIVIAAGSAPRVARLRESATTLDAMLRTHSIDVRLEPIVELDGTRLGHHAVAVDAPGGSDLSKDFFADAERLGRAEDLDSLCRQATLARAGHLLTDELLFIGVHHLTLAAEGVKPGRLAREVRAAGLCPGNVVLEITEHSAARTDQLARAAQRLRDSHFKLALSAGNASMAVLPALQALPLDFIKLDGNLIGAATRNPSESAVLHALLSAAAALGIDVIAEGIETPEALELIRRIGSEPLAPRGLRGAQGPLVGASAPAASDIAAA